MKKIFALLSFMFALSLSQACSVVQATSGEKAKDLSVLDKGTNRYKVLAELGQPVASEVDSEGNKVDIFNFLQGQHGAAKAGKAVGYGILAVTTLGLSEVVTSPLEGAAGKGAEIQVKVSYDSEENVEEVVFLKDGRWIPLQKVDSSSSS